MRINHNIAALNAYRNLSVNNENTSKSLEKLSSGLRINRAADDAAGLAISEKMRSQIRGLDMASRNAMDGISVVQTADGALNSTTEILQRMRELTVQAANDSNTDTDRQNIQKEIDQLTTEINRIGNSTEFNTKSLLNGSLSGFGEAKLIKNGSTVGALGSSVTIDPHSVLSTGRYSVDITKTSGTPYQNIGSVTDYSGSSTALNVIPVSPTYNSDVALPAGNYYVEVSTNGNGYYAQIKDSRGVSMGSKVLLTGTTHDSTMDLGNNINLSYDGTNPGTTLKTGDLSFSVKDITPVSYTMSLKQDTDINGSFDTTLWYSRDFNLGEKVTFPGTGIEVQTYPGTTETDYATFEVEDGKVDNGAKMQIGANAGQTVSLEINDMRAKALQLSTDTTGGGEKTVTLLDGKNQQVWYTKVAGASDGAPDSAPQYSLDVTNSDKAQAAMTVIDEAVQRVSSERARLGAIQNRLEYTVDNLKTMSENVTSSESRIRDVDMAEEMTNFTKNNILNQAAQAMLAQANQLPQGVLQLLK